MICIAGPINSDHCDSADPTLWLEQRVIKVLKSRTGLGQPMVKQRYANAYFGRTARMWGYSFCFENQRPPLFDLRRFIMISRTHVASGESLARENKPTLHQLVSELEYEVRCIPEDKFGRYHVELGIPGTYATVECSGKNGRYYFMISESGRMKPYSLFERLFPGL
jgi:hypothetical protein